MQLQTDADGIAYARATRIRTGPEGQNSGSVEFSVNLWREVYHPRGFLQLENCVAITRDLEAKTLAIEARIAGQHHFWFKRSIDAEGFSPHIFEREEIFIGYHPPSESVIRELVSIVLPHAALAKAGPLMLKFGVAEALPALASVELSVPVAPPAHQEAGSYLPTGNPLSSREMEVLSLLQEGLSNPGIAKELAISDRTVESHVASIMKKTGHHDRSDFIAQKWEQYSHSPSADNSLSSREREVLNLLQDGKETPEIARRLKIGRKTVYVYVSDIAKKMGYATGGNLIEHVAPKVQVPHVPATPVQYQRVPPSDISNGGNPLPVSSVVPSPQRHGLTGTRQAIAPTTTATKVVASLAPGVAQPNLTTLPVNGATKVAEPVGHPAPNAAPVNYVSKPNVSTLSFYGEALAKLAAGKPPFDVDQSTTIIYHPQDPRFVSELERVLSGGKIPRIYHPYDGSMGVYSKKTGNTAVTIDFNTEKRSLPMNSSLELTYRGDVWKVPGDEELRLRIEVVRAEQAPVLASSASTAMASEKQGKAL